MMSRPVQNTPGAEFPLRGYQLLHQLAQPGCAASEGLALSHPRVINTLSTQSAEVKPGDFVNVTTTVSLFYAFSFALIRSLFLSLTLSLFDSPHPNMHPHDRLR